MYDGLMADSHTDVLVAPYRGNQARNSARKKIRTTVFHNLSPHERAEYRMKWEAEDKAVKKRDGKISHSRKIIEHYFARMKVFFPILSNLASLKSDLVTAVFRVCLMYTNIMHIFCNPLRKHECFRGRKCFYCTDIAGKEWYFDKTSWIQEYDADLDWIKRNQGTPVHEIRADQFALDQSLIERGVIPDLESLESDTEDLDESAVMFEHGGMQFDVDSDAEWNFGDELDVPMALDQEMSERMSDSSSIVCFD